MRYRETAISHRKYTPPSQSLSRYTDLIAKEQKVKGLNDSLRKNLPGNRVAIDSRFAANPFLEFASIH